MSNGAIGTVRLGRIQPMLNLKDFRIEICTDGPGKEMCSFHAQLSPEKKVRQKGEWSDPVSGLGYISFYMTREELNDLVSGKIGAVQDIGHRLDVSGEVWTFYDFNGSASKNNGVLEVPYQRVEIPRLWAQVLCRALNRIWDVANANLPDESYQRNTAVIEFPPEYCARILRVYGQGKGKIAFIPGDHRPEVTIERMRESALASQSMRDSLDRLRNIAANMTYSKLETGEIHISAEYGGNGFYWTLRTSDGRRGMSGGLINHSRDDGGHDWSIHT